MVNDAICIYISINIVKKVILVRRTQLYFAMFNINNPKN